MRSLHPVCAAIACVILAAMLLRRLSRSSLLLALLIAAACDSAVEGEAKVEAKAEGGGEANAAAAAEAEAGGSAVVKSAAAVAGEAGGGAAVEGEAAASVTIEAEALDLDGVTALIKKGKVKSAKDLEKTINNPSKKLAKIDVDGDGTLDFVQVVEVRKEAEVVFELRVVPSSKKSADAAVTVATIAVVPDKASSKVTVRAVYTPVVVHHEIYVYEYAVPATWQGDVVVVAGNPFFGWTFAVEREAYVGVYVHEEWVAVPGVMIVVVDGGCWPPGHCKRGKYKHGKWKGHRGHKVHKGKGKW